MLRCFCSLIQETSFVFGSATSLLDCATAAVAAKNALLSVFLSFSYFCVRFFSIKKRYLINNNLYKRFNILKAKKKSIFYLVNWTVGSSLYLI